MTHALPPGWEEKTLGELCVSVLDGDWIESKDQAPAGIRLIQTGNIGVGVFLNKEQKSRFISEKTFDRLHCTEVFPGDCLVSRLPDPIGRSCLVPSLEGRMITAVDCSILRFNEKEILPQYFIYHTLRNAYFHAVLKESTGTTRKRISRKKLLAMQIMFPPLPEQKRIVEKLDKIFAAIDKAKSQTEKNLQNVREIFETTLRSCFAQGRHLWPQKRLVEVCTDFGRGKSKHRPRNDVSLYGGKYPFIQTGDIRSASHKITSYHQTYNEKGLQQSKLWPKGTLCITIAANIAETAILDFDACFPDSVIGCIFNPNLADVSYAEYLLHAFRAILQKESKGSAQANINLGTFERQTFPFPLISEQKQIVGKLDILQFKTKELEKIYTQKLADLEELKQSVLQQAFSGKL